MSDAITELRGLIRKGTVKNVAEYGGSSKSPAVPYVVIQPGPAYPDKKEFQIWAHFAVGKNKELENYVLGELPGLVFDKVNLLGQSKYKSNATYDGISMNEADGTIRAGKVFYLPLIIR